MLLRLVALFGTAAAMVVPGTAQGVAKALPRARVPMLSYGRPNDEQDSGFSFSGQQFDVLSLRSFRRDTILQYDATNQSEPLRIALTLFGLLFSLSVPALSSELRIGDALTSDVTAVLGTGISGFLFARNRNARTARMAKIDKEYALGDLRATFRGVRTSYLRELRGKRRVVAVVGPRAVVDGAISLARVYRRRLSASDTIVVPVYLDDSEIGDVDGSASGNRAKVVGGEAESKYLWSAADPTEWRSYFNEILEARGLTTGGAAWIGLNVKGRTFGSALGPPTWDELLGTACQPVGDGFGEYKEVDTPMDDAAAEAVAAATAMGTVSPGGEAAGTAAVAARNVLEAQQAFYAALTSGNVEAMAEQWATVPDASVSETLESGARIEPWATGSSAFPPPGMRPTDCDCLVLSDCEAWSTAVERPREGGTLLATQRWRRDDPNGPWRLSTHRYIPWSADGATAIAALRCDYRGAVLLGRQINTRAP